mmetsp:Transcript_11480/g.18739  ORF Transcript_11480/g.18739 Transcript_11480/m.18739 type:complete len:209 (-) Transcript_11480:89-715(-)
MSRLKSHEIVEDVQVGKATRRAAAAIMVVRLLQFEYICIGGSHLHIQIPIREHLFFLTGGGVNIALGQLHRSTCHLGNVNVRDRIVTRVHIVVTADPVHHRFSDIFRLRDIRERHDFSQVSALAVSNRVVPNHVFVVRVIASNVRLGRFVPLLYISTSKLVEVVIVDGHATNARGVLGVRVNQVSSDFNVSCELERVHGVLDFFGVAQ